MANRVFSGLVTDWRFAGWPTSRSPASVNATIDGVVRAPSVFSMTRTSLPSMTATHEFVVPRSMPITLLISHLFLRQAQATRLFLRQAQATRLGVARTPTGGRSE